MFIVPARNLPKPEAPVYTSGADSRKDSAMRTVLLDALAAIPKALPCEAVRYSRAHAVVSCTRCLASFALSATSQPYSVGMMPRSSATPPLSR